MCTCSRMPPSLTDMNLDGDSSMPVSCGNGKLRQWLIDQIDSGEYSGLVWENDEKTIFRIPWKHAGKQDYNRDEDAALFKAWALFKGKHREGLDKPDPPTWKTRLRCALNKSNDFDELVERSQLDISDPYKVYRIIPEAAKRGSKSSSMDDSVAHVAPISYPMHSPYPPLQPQMPGYMLPQERRDWREYSGDQPHPQAPHAELPYGQCPYPPTRSLPWHPSACDNGYQISGSFYTYSPTETHPVAMDPGIRSAEAMAVSDCRLHVSLYYRESLVKEVTTSSPEGCRISSSSSPGSPSSPISGFVHHGRPMPRSQVVLCFGDEFPDPQRQSKMITAQVEPMFARQLLYFAGQTNGHYLRGYELQSPGALPVEEYQRSIQHLQE
ncbi:interferon regulatory factor 4-like [Sinocyclocheilus rhinocerous]|uniref:interferon regulatory factor 4-like n=1 Tax=Sinocyclocheilus rhinocerous TaxID=307959 RepID=UPI0007B88AEC|nr:PREDICTED: interferon regulatory factor 4-like [Sinocyclocheilus rhinocerous]